MKAPASLAAVRRVRMCPNAILWGGDGEVSGIEGLGSGRGMGEGGREGDLNVFARTPN